MRYPLDRRGNPYLGLAHAKKLLFISEVDLNVPAPDVSLDDLLGEKSGIGTNEIGGIPVEKGGLLSVGGRRWAR